MRDDFRATLDQAARAAANSDASVFMPPVINYLSEARQSRSFSPHFSVLTEICRAHELHEICLEDPHTRHAYEKPRGFAGDAQFIDFFYGYNGPRRSDTSRGAGLFSHFMSYKNCDGIRFRRAYLASLIDSECRRCDGSARIASIACGHFREIDFSIEISQENFDVLYGLDQDPQALELVKTNYGDVTPINESIRAILNNKTSFEDLDLIYTAGLYDYLTDRTATRLAQKMFGFLRSGGLLVFANALPNILARGYMEAFMDWNLVYRSESDMASIIASIPEVDIASQRVVVDPLQAVVYALVRKA